MVAWGWEQLSAENSLWKKLISSIFLYVILFFLFWRVLCFWREAGLLPLQNEFLVLKCISPPKKKYKLIFFLGTEEAAYKL